MYLEFLGSIVTTRKFLTICRDDLKPFVTLSRCKLIKWSTRKLWKLKTKLLTKMVTVLFSKQNLSSINILSVEQICLLPCVNLLSNLEKNISLNRHNAILLNKLVEISQGKWSSVPKTSALTRGISVAATAIGQ